LAGNTEHCAEDEIIIGKRIAGNREGRRLQII
jgi:hypothetical protein